MRATLLATACAVGAGLTLDVRAYGADSTGRAPSTLALRAAFAAVNAAGGGTVYIPPGTYRSGPFNLSSNSVLLLDDATLIAEHIDSGNWSLIAALPSYGEGRDKLPNDLNGRFEPFIGAFFVSNVTITTNSSGLIDGSGDAWWVAKAAGTLRNTPPHLFEAAWSSGVNVGAPAGAPLNALVLESSPFWTVHIYDCDDSHIHDVSIFADVDSANTDGVDPDSSRNTLIERVIYVGGDDGIAIKSGWDDAGIKYNRPVVNVTVRDSSFTTRAGCVCVGSEMSGGAANISVYNVSCVNVGNGFYIKSSPGRGGYVRNFSFTDSTITGAQSAFTVMLTYGDNPTPPLTYNLSQLPILDGFTFARIRGAGVQFAGELSGASGSPVGGVMVTNVRVEDVDVGATRGWRCANISGTASGVVPPISAATCPQLA
jgi:polygalacturonase